VTATPPVHVRLWPTTRKERTTSLHRYVKSVVLHTQAKKADLVKRLEEYDERSTAPDALTDAPPATNEDEIDWDDEPATTQAAANAIAAGGRGPATNPQAVPNQNAAVDPAQTNDLSIAAEPTSAAPIASEPAAASSEEEKDFSTGLADRTLDDEIEKRKARARKFGMPEDSEEIKALERAKRFGTTNLPGLLNKALPEKQDRKRASEGNVDTDEGLRKRTRGRPGPGRKGAAAGSGGGGGAKPNAESRGAGYPQWMTDKDRAAADKRKNRFSETTAA